jgi:hypothetical protein
MTTLGDWRVYNTFIHIDAVAAIGVRRVQSAPGELSFRGPDDDTALRGTEETTVDAEHEVEDGTAHQVETAVAAMILSRRSGVNFRRRDRKKISVVRKAALSAVQGWIATAKKNIAARVAVALSRSWIAAAIRNVAAIRKQPTHAGAVATCGSDVFHGFHASVVHPHAQQWTSSRPSWRKEKRVVLRDITTWCQLHDSLLPDDWIQLLPDGAWCQQAAGFIRMDGLEMHDVESDWIECPHCGEDVLEAWTQCNLCFGRLYNN